MRSIMRCLCLPLLCLCASLSAMTITDVVLGKHESGPSLTSKDLTGKVVYVVYWGFGTYGDIMIRDRKMYVAPTPFALTEGTTGLMTLILTESTKVDSRFREVGRLTRIEADSSVVGYTFDLRTNELKAERIPNPNAGDVHRFVAYRLAKHAPKPVSMVKRLPVPGETYGADEE